MGIFLTHFLKALQVGISIDATGLGLCSMKSTVGELFAAPPTRSHLASLVDKRCALGLWTFLYLGTEELSQGAVVLVL